MNQCKNSDEFFINEEEDLVFTDNADTKEDEEYDFDDDDDDEDEEVNESNEPTSSQSSYSPPKKISRNFIKMEDKEKAVNYWKFSKIGRYGLGSVKSRFRFVTSLKQLRRFDKQIQNGGSRIDKFKSITDYTYEMYKNARNKKLIVKDVDLRRWALKKKNEVKLDNFKASKEWIRKFKINHRVVSRKITKFVTHSFSKSEADILIKANNFVGNSKQYFTEDKLSSIFNSDQSGFSYEIHSGRTLDDKGKKRVEAVAKSLSSLTHSYTIQPTISADGRLLSPLYIVLQEKDGKFPAKFDPKKDVPKNIFLQASSSGKLTKQHLLNWFAKVYFKQAPDESVLLLDSWTTYNDENAINREKPEGKNIKILRIPPKTTGMIQPCDRFFFRVWKSFVRKFEDRVLLDSLPIVLHSRETVIKLQSLITTQFQAPKFRDFIKYSWFKCGYLDKRPPNFQTPVQYCFNYSDEICYSDCSQCTEGVFIICAWCSNPMCFKHFFIDMHNCNELEQ